MLFRTKVFGRTYEFKDVKEVLAKANEQKSGDMAAGIAAKSVEERVAAKVVLAETPLWVLRANPVVPYEKDEVTRAIDDGIDAAAYNKVKDWTVGQLKEWILAEKTTTEDINAIVRGCKQEGADVIVDCSANAAAVNASFEWLKNRGSKYCFQAYYPDLTPIDMLWPHVKEMVGYFPTNVTDAGMREMMQWIADGRAQVRPLLTHLRGWRDAPELFRLMMDQTSDCLGMVLDWQGCHD